MDYLCSYRCIGLVRSFCYQASPTDEYSMKSVRAYYVHMWSEYIIYWAISGQPKIILQRGSAVSMLALLAAFGGRYRDPSHLTFRVCSLTTERDLVSAYTNASSRHLRTRQPRSQNAGTASVAFTVHFPKQTPTLFHSIAIVITHRINVIRTTRVHHQAASSPSQNDFISATACSDLGLRLTANGFGILIVPFR
jgi:hypothetical protein